jgi:hypothetical protein
MKTPFGFKFVATLSPASPDPLRRPPPPDAVRRRPGLDLRPYIGYHDELEGVEFRALTSSLSLSLASVPQKLGRAFGLPERTPLEAEPLEPIYNPRLRGSHVRIMKTHRRCAASSGVAWPGLPGAPPPPER